MRGFCKCSHIMEYAALSKAPRALADDLMLVFQHPVKDPSARGLISERDDRHVEENQFAGCSGDPAGARHHGDPARGVQGRGLPQGSHGVQRGYLPSPKAGQESFVCDRPGGRRDPRERGGRNAGRRPGRRGCRLGKQSEGRQDRSDGGRRRAAAGEHGGARGLQHGGGGDVRDPPHPHPGQERQAGGGDAGHTRWS